MIKKKHSKLCQLIMGIAILLLMTSYAYPSTSMASTASPVVNAGFEEPVNGTQIPGWSLFGTPNPASVSYSVTNEKAHSGSNSLKIVDNSGSDGIALWSNQLRVIPGESYTGSVWINIGPTFNGTPNRGSFVMRFYDKDDTRVGPDTAVVHHTGTSAWTKLATTATAPATAHTVRVLASLSNLWQTNGAYYDDFNIEGNLYVEDIPAAQSLTLNGAAAARMNHPYEVKLQAIQAANLYTVNASVYYDAAQFEFVSAAAAPSFGGLVTSKVITPGELQVIATQLGDQSLTGNVDMATLTFNALQKTSSTSIRLDKASTAFKIDADSTHKVYSFNTDSILSVPILGSIEDVNGDSQINLADLLAVANKVGTPVTAETAGFDLNSDGTIGIADLSLISMAILGGDN